MKTSLKKYISHFICKGSKRVTQGLRVRGSWIPNKTAKYWQPLLWPSALCLSRSPGLLNRRPRGPALCWVMAFFTTSYQQLLWTPTQSGAPSPFGLVWLSLPNLVSNSVRSLTFFIVSHKPPCLTRTLSPRFVSDYCDIWVTCPLCARSRVTTCIKVAPN